MPAHRLRRARHRTRVPARAWPCPGARAGPARGRLRRRGRAQGRRTAGERQRPRPDAAPSPSDEPAPDPGFQAPKVGQCYQMTAAQSRASVARGRKVQLRRAAHHRRRLRRLRPQAGHPADPGRPAPGPRASGSASRPTAARRRHARRPGDLDPHLDAVHPGPGPARARRPLGALRRARAQRRPADAAARRAAPCSRQGVPEQLRVCQDRGRRRRLLLPAARLPGRGGLPGRRAGLPRPHRPTPPTARDPLQGADGEARRLLAAAEPGRAGAPATGSSAACSATTAATRPA